MEDPFIHQLYQAHQQTRELPAPTVVCQWLNGLLGVLFPELSDQRFVSLRELELYYRHLQLELGKIIAAANPTQRAAAPALETAFMAGVPDLRAALLLDAQAILNGDPAARDLTEVIRTYPGFYAIAAYRLAHHFYQLDVPLIPRILSEYAHGKTGIDIHPGATIGTYFCIDHGTGVVIGETCHIGNRVKIYQGVTLGALSVRKDLAQVKRHPTIEDEVVIYSGATILGGETVIGRGSIIGGNVWLTKSVAPGSRVYYSGQPNQRVEDANLAG